MLTLEFPDGTWTYQGIERWTNPAYSVPISRTMDDFRRIWADREFELIQILDDTEHPRL